MQSGLNLTDTMATDLRSWPENHIHVYWESIDATTFHHADIKRSISKSLRLRSIISRKGADVGPIYRY